MNLKLKLSWNEFEIKLIKFEIEDLRIFWLKLWMMNLEIKAEMIVKIMCEFEIKIVKN